MADVKSHQWLISIGETNIVAYEQMGWMFAYPQYVGDHLVIGMEYRCCCREWEIPPILIKQRYWT